MTRIRTAATLGTISEALLDDYQAPADELLAEELGARIHSLLDPVFSGEVDDPTRSSPKTPELGKEAPARAQFVTAAEIWGFETAEYDEGSSQLVRVEVPVDLDKLKGNEAYRDELVTRAKNAVVDLVQEYREAQING